MSNYLEEIFEDRIKYILIDNLENIIFRKNMML